MKQIIVLAWLLFTLMTQGCENMPEMPLGDDAQTDGELLPGESLDELPPGEFLKEETSQTQTFGLSDESLSDDETLSGEGTGVGDPIITDESTLVEPDVAADFTDTTVYPVLYFGTNKTTLDEKYNYTLKTHADYLLANPTAMVVIEGHTDERGTPDYNLALGERRAKSVLEAILFYGVNVKQLKDRSFGEEMAAVKGSGEAVWQKNRRVEIKYQMVE